MPSLDRDRRKELERTIRLARRVAEDGARKAIEQLAVHNHEPWDSLTAPQRTLRVRLRAHGRQIGDFRDDKRGTQTIDHLIRECAYEQWHRMLFARFLAEADLLIEPLTGVPITLSEARELAREKSRDWLDLASDYAVRMLPQLFRRDDPVLDITLPLEAWSKLEDLLEGLAREVFLADDSLGWVYQFWQADRKDEVNRSNAKFGDEELPAVTQIFTEDYMVRFLLHNTLGAWWAARVLEKKPELAISAQSEDELRLECRVGEIEWTYLRFVREEVTAEAEPRWRPAAGAYSGWPKRSQDITILDPCMGSGHFLASALPILVAMRMDEERLTHSSAVEAVLRDNLFGLEIDPRCSQIAAFNLALTAWRAIGHKQLPQLSIACSGLAIGVAKAEWLELAMGAGEVSDPTASRDLFGMEENLLTVGISARVKNGLDRLYDLFAKAPWLGSLIEPRRSESDIFHVEFASLEPHLASILQTNGHNQLSEMAVAAQGLTKAIELLMRQFTLVVTNVPYLARKKQDAVLADYCNEHYPAARANLAMCMLERCLAFCESGGSAAVVAPQNPLFLGLYKKLREKLLKTTKWDMVMRLGTKAFQTPMWDLGVALILLTRSQRPRNVTFAGGDVCDSKTAADKAIALRSNRLLAVSQNAQIETPGAAIVFEHSADVPLLSELVDFGQGSHTGDSAHFHRYFWELPQIFSAAEPWLNDPRPGELWSARALVSVVAVDDSRLKEERGVRINGQNVWGRRGVAINKMGSFAPIIYTGEVFDDNVGVLATDDDSVAAALLCYIESGEYVRELRKIDQALKVTAATLTKVPFDLERWHSAALGRYPNGLPPARCDDPAQWIFSGDPATSKHPLQTAVARLVGYEWPRQTGSTFVGYPMLGSDALQKHAERDGIVCLSAIAGKSSAEERLVALLADAFGSSWSAGKLAGLLKDIGFVEKSLGDWLRDGFFLQHCELFRQRPFVWHIWDGRRDGFHALVNYHHLSGPAGQARRTIEKLMFSYLGDWIDRQRAEQRANREGADSRLAASEFLRSELAKILDGESPYDIFVRWKQLHEQPIGWEPDISDGVRVNVRPFVRARPFGARGTNCILRVTPKLRWDKDRGSEASRERFDYPWFWECDGKTKDFQGGPRFDGVRWNDLHYSRAFKQFARERRAATSVAL